MDQLPFTGQDIEMVSISSTINPQLLQSSGYMVGNLSTGGGRDLLYLKSIPSSFPLPSATVILTFLLEGLRLGQKCLSLAKTEKDPGWQSEMNRMHDYFACQEADERDDTREQLDRAIDDRDEAQYKHDKAIKKHDELESLVKKLENSEPSVAAGSKRKKTDSDRMGINSELSLSVFLRLEPVLVLPSTYLNSTFPFPCPPHRAVGLVWYELNGHLQVPHQFQNMVRHSQFPTVLTIIGTPSSTQVPPFEYSQLAQLEQDAKIPGNWPAVAHCQAICLMVMLLDYIHSKAPNLVPALSGTKRDLLTLPASPSWTTHSAYIEFKEFSNSNDTTCLFEDQPCEIPSVLSSPPSSDTDTEGAEGMFVHYNHSFHLGNCFSDNGHICLYTVQAFQLFMALSPINVGSEEGKAIPQFRTTFINLLTNIGFYRKIVGKDHLVIAPTRNIIPCSVTAVENACTLATHFASCSIPIEEIKSYVYFVLYCCPDAI
ncbi:hypothetical protein L218DRAFT_951825 [Marasmius fiardii PR-910]|nr:hypothetical protein L218DRAFT_951825 [Marasmius fiardii PR-910]